MLSLQVKNLSKAFGKKVILDDISFDVPKGQSLVVLGGSGTGKSVLLKNILRLLVPDTGHVLVEGKNITTATGKEYQNLLDKFGMLFQGGALFDSLTIWENITFALRQRQKVKIPDAIAIAVDLLGQVGLTSDVALLMPSELSGGMQKRVAMARAICTKPDILFFDEPTAGLDPIMAGMISELILTTVKKLGVTAITITHDMHCMNHIADSVLMLYGGKILWHGQKSEMDSCQDPYFDAFIHGKQIQA